MGVDTKSMREIVDAAPGDRMAMRKSDLHALIDAAPGDHVAIEKGQLRGFLGAIDLGRVADQLAAHAGELRAMAIAV
jgi:hypothetical protein